MIMEDLLVLGGRSIKNRLLIGTGKFSSYPVMKKALEAAQPDIVTVALRRVDAGSQADNILEYIPKACLLMANTSGARNADEAVRIARLAKAGGQGNWIKIEVVQDNKYLLPDNLETLKAVEILVKEGFIVLPYMSPDLSMAKRMADAGAAAESGEVQQVSEDDPEIETKVKELLDWKDAKLDWQDDDYFDEP